MTNRPLQTSPHINVLSIVALVCAFIASIVGGILGLVALRQIKRTGEAGRGMALSATIIGFALFALNLVIAAIIFWNIMATSVGQ